MIDKKFSSLFLVFTEVEHHFCTKSLKENDKISGLENTNEIEDEGQHVQSVYEPAYKYGGVGKFGFNENLNLMRHQF